MRLMSFSMTKAQYVAGTKQVTRRLGWLDLMPGERFEGIEKGQGLKKGEKVVRLGPSLTVGVRREPLNVITPRDVRREGFPDLSTEGFIDMFCRANGCARDEQITRISFRLERPCPCPKCGELMWLELMGNRPKLWLRYTCPDKSCDGFHPANWDGTPVKPSTRQEVRARVEARALFQDFWKGDGQRARMVRWKAFAWLEDRIPGLPSRFSQMTEADCNAVIAILSKALGR